jgi:hypothetical protein
MGGGRRPATVGHAAQAPGASRLPDQPLLRRTHAERDSAARCPQRGRRAADRWRGPRDHHRQKARRTATAPWTPSLTELGDGLGGLVVLVMVMGVAYAFATGAVRTPGRRPVGMDRSTQLKRRRSPNAAGTFVGNDTARNRCTARQRSKAEEPASRLGWDLRWDTCHWSGAPVILCTGHFRCPTGLTGRALGWAARRRSRLGVVCPRRTTGRRMPPATAPRRRRRPST